MCSNCLGKDKNGIASAWVFLAAAREKNFTHAAEQLHITQPTLFCQIADFEDKLGVKLFTRSNHNIILTEDGRLLKRRAGNSEFSGKDEAGFFDIREVQKPRDCSRGFCAFR